MWEGSERGRESSKKNRWRISMVSSHSELKSIPQRHQASLSGRIHSSPHHNFPRSVEQGSVAELFWLELGKTHNVIYQCAG